MDEKNNQTLSFDEILNQLTKPSVIQGQGQSVGNPSSPQPLSRPQNLPQTPGGSSGVRLPSLGGESRPVQGSGPLSGQAQSAEVNISLSIRTMAQDIDRLRAGQVPTPIELKRVIQPIVKPMPVPTPQASKEMIKQAPMNPIPSLPSLPRPIAPLRPATPLPGPSAQNPLPPLSQTKPSPEKPRDEYSQDHFHKEEVVGKIDDLLPEYLGAQVPKKTATPVKEILQYGVIAKIIGSGMTAGITATVVIAIAAYFLLSFFIFNKEEPLLTPTPTPVMQTTPTPEYNELDAIFKNVIPVNFSLPANQVETSADLKTFIKETAIDEMEFKRINFVLPNNQVATLTFTDLMDRLEVQYPVELKDAIREGNMAFMYGQGETFGEQSSLPDPDLANKKVVLIVEVKDLIRAKEILGDWEATMAMTLKDVLNIDPNRAATPGFIDNAHGGAPIRYMNFPLPDRSIDYAIVHSLTGRQYLIIANSRESVYSPIEKITGL